MGGATVTGPKGSTKLPSSMMDGNQEIIRDQSNPKDLNVRGEFEKGELTKVTMQVSWDAAKGKGDEITFDKNGTLTVNGQVAHPPMTTENGTVISETGGKVSINTKAGDHFTLDKTACPAINMEGDVAPNRGTGNVHSDMLGNFDDDPNSTWVAKNDAQKGSGTGAAGGASGAAAAGGSTPLASATDPFEELRKIFSAMATSGGDAPPPASPAGAFLGRVASPDLKAAILEHGKQGGGIDAAALASAISDPAERDKFLHTLTDGKSSVEDAVKSLSKPGEQLAVLKSLVGDDKAADLQAKLFAKSPA